MPGVRRAHEALAHCATWPSGSTAGSRSRRTRCRTRSARCSAPAGSSSCRRPASSRGCARSRTRARSSAIRRAARAADRAFEALTAETWVGHSERELAWRLRQLLHAHGVDEPSLRHRDRRRRRTARGRTREPGDQLVEPRTLVVADWGARLGGYCSDCTRTLATGDAADGAPARLRRLPRGAARRGRGHPAGHDRRRGRPARPRRDRGGRLRRELRPRPRPRGRRRGARGAAALDRVAGHARGRQRGHDRAGDLPAGRRRRPDRGPGGRPRSDGVERR